jgi:levansucrase
MIDATAAQSVAALQPALHPVDWRADHLADARMSQVQVSQAQRLPRLRPADVRRLGDTLDAWDAWPIQTVSGQPALFHGAELWMTLAAPVADDPNLRHRRARIHLLQRQPEATGGGWRDLGPAMPDGFSPGICEWSGCAVWRPDTPEAATGRVELHFTVTGRRGQPFETRQRLCVTSARLDWTDGEARLTGWTPVRETLAPHVAWRQPADGVDPAPGFIHALRDPALFRDPDDGQEYLVYAASLAGAPLHRGAIGIAMADCSGGWTDLGPLLRADGLNHELERPHLVRTSDGIYLFWCTQAKMFAPGGPVGPTGLYAVFAPALNGRWTPVNGSGLVAANPPDAPSQTYAWWVTGVLEVHGFVDVLPDAPPGDRCRVFAGGLAPPFHLELDGPTSRIR